MLLGLLLAGADQAARPVKRLTRHNQSRRQQSLAGGNDAIAAGLLTLAGEDRYHMVLLLHAEAIREEHQALGVLVQLAGGLLDHREALVDLRQSLVAQVVGLADVGRDVLIGLFEVVKDGLGEDLVGRVAKGNAALADLVLLDGADAVSDNGVVQEVLCVTVVSLASER